MKQRFTINPFLMYAFKFLIFFLMIDIVTIMLEYLGVRTAAYQGYIDFFINHPNLLQSVKENSWLRQFILLDFSRLNVPDYFLLLLTAPPLYMLAHQLVGFCFETYPIFTPKMMPAPKAGKPAKPKKELPKLADIVKRKTMQPLMEPIASSSTPVSLPEKKHKPAPIKQPKLPKQKKTKPEGSTPTWFSTPSNQPTEFEFYTRKVEVPEKLQEVFKVLAKYSEDVFCVGSSVIDLVQGKPLGDNADLDFLAFNIDTSLLDSQKFMRTNNKDLFKYYDPETQLKFELYVRNDLNNLTPKYRLKEALLCRDYTICTFALNKDGTVFIPKQSFYINDICGKRLKTVQQDVEACFNEDPVRILRALKYIERGFEPVPTLDDALRHWPGESNIVEKHKVHIHAVMNGMLRNEAKREAYIALLKEYKLLEKLFFIDPKHSLKELYQSLLERLETTRPGYRPRTHDELAQKTEPRP